MEMDELKSAWAALDNRLKKNEELKESIILEIMRSKAGKLVNRFIIWEMSQIIVILLGIPFCFFQFERFAGKNLAISVTLIYSVVLGVIGFFWYVYKLHGLMKIDVSKNVGNNIFYINRYRIQLNKEKKTGCFLVGIPIIVLMVFSYASMKVAMPLWIFMICIFIIFGLIIYWQYKYYNKGIDSILKSLDEIKELKEE